MTCESPPGLGYQTYLDTINVPTQRTLRRNATARAKTSRPHFKRPDRWSGERGRPRLPTWASRPSLPIRLRRDAGHHTRDAYAPRTDDARHGHYARTTPRAGGRDQPEWLGGEAAAWDLRGPLAGARSYGARERVGQKGQTGLRTPIRLRRDAGHHTRDACAPAYRRSLLQPGSPTFRPRTTSFLPNKNPGQENPAGV